MRRTHRLSRAIILIAVFSMVGASIILTTWDMSPPIRKIERILPDERFPK